MHVEKGKLLCTSPSVTCLLHFSLQSVRSLCLPCTSYACHVKGNRGTRSGFLIHSSFGSLSPLMEKETRDSSRPRPEELMKRKREE